MRHLPTLLAVFFLASAVSHAAPVPDMGGAPPPFLTVKHSEIRLGYERIALPGGEAMGMVGGSYLIEVAPRLYVGPAVYGAVTGRRGGFFTEGIEVALRQRLFSSLDVEAGVYGGGGGGGAAQVGGGLMLRPHADLLWDFGAYRAGVSASQVRFANGSITSRQAGLVFSTDSHFAYFPANFIGQEVDAQDHGGVGFDRVLLVVGIYKPRPGSITSGAPASIGQVGARFEQFFTPTLYRGIEAVAGASGGVAGYAEFLGTLGAEIPVYHDAVALGARLALGMGGGGAVAVEGGGLIKAGAYAMVDVTRNSHFALEGGYASAPTGRFRATYGSANFVWDLDHPYAASRRGTIAGNEWVAGSEHYFGAARKDGSRRGLDAIAIKLNRYLTPSLYVTGQAHSAYAGNAGAYSAGLVGMGYRTAKVDGGFSAGAEFLVGAAGGGAVDTGGGAIVQPMAYVDREVTRSAGVRLSVGRIKSLGGALNSTVVDISASFLFGTPAR